MSETQNIKKTERLSAALYLITGFFGDKEPLKWELRSTATRLVSVYLSEEGDSKHDATYSGTRALIREILSLLSVAKTAGLVSEMNFEVVSKEFGKLLQAINIPELGFSATSDTPVLSNTFFAEVPAIQAPVSQTNVPEQSVQKTEDIRDTSPKVIPEGLLPEVAVPVTETKTAEPVTAHVQHEVQVEVPKEAKKSEKQSGVLKEFGAVAVKKNSRQSVIINLLKRKKEIMIKDVSPLIDGVSEKTIQRELLGMVKSGILTKEGEKRWSTYSLAN